MKFAQFYHPSTGWNGKDYSGPVKLIEGCGSDSVLPLDGRWSQWRCVDHARAVCKARGFNGFALHEGQSYSRSHIARALEVVTPL